MSFRMFFKRVISFVPRWCMDLCAFFVRNKNQQDMSDDNFLKTLSPDTGNSSLNPKRRFFEKKYDLKIIIPCYNSKEYIEECIQSVLSQKTKYKIKLVLINDGSSDQTLTVLKKYESKNVTVIDKENGGSASARNKGLEDVESEFLMFIDSDDCLLGGDSLDFMLDTAYSTKNEFGDKIIIEFKHAHFKTKAQICRALNKVNYLKLSGFSWAKIFSTSLFNKVNFPEQYWFEDTVLSILIYPQAHNCFINKSTIYFYRPTENSMTEKSKISVKTIDTFYVTRQLFYDRNALNLPEDNNYFCRFYLQTICNCVRLSPFSSDIQIKVFFETIKLFEKLGIKRILKFRVLYKSFVKHNFERYKMFCLLYSKMYLNL